MQQAIEALDLTKRYGASVAIEALTFTVGAGEVFGLLGPNGAGKTTTILILCTLLRATAGRATIGGLDVTHQPADVRRLIGVVFQEPCLDERLTVRETLALQAALYALPPSVARQRVDELAELVGLRDRLRELVATLSGGLRRRLDLARGLLHRPKVLLLDEPTLGLDPRSRSCIWEYIRALRQREGMTVFLTTNDMEEAEQSDRVAILDRGRLIALDTADALRGLVGGDTVVLRTADDALARQRIEQRWGFEVQISQDGLSFKAPRSSELIPTLIEWLGLPVHSVSSSTPTLNDVFLGLTGHEMHNERPDRGAAMRRWLKWRRRSGRY